jgi:hypothetical protein
LLQAVNDDHADDYDVVEEEGGEKKKKISWPYFHRCEMKRMPMPMWWLLW